ncbi:hypothetical protein [Staphylococcus xylosus]|uniref:hypothetical protein n=1 Tax=Staphylococcus xylosus TaxID=1288 RepID=UPI0015C54C5A|nr:hypothetical protein [Staphylococcus xylosus]NQD97587.1 hypothetical protein [Staphylococcus xylosus]
MNRLDSKTVIIIIGVISLTIFAFIFTVGYILSNIDPKNKLEGYTIAISFIGIFATFGGAYLGARIAGEYTLNAVEKQNEKEQHSKNIKIRNKMTLSIVRVEDEISGLSEHLSSFYETNDPKGLTESNVIVDVFATPFLEISKNDETYESDKDIYIPMLQFISACNRMQNYSSHSFDYSLPSELNQTIITGYRDIFLNESEICERKEKEKDYHPYIVDASIIFNILVKELNVLKERVLEEDLYNSIGFIDGEYHEQRVYKIGNYK